MNKLLHSVTQKKVLKIIYILLHSIVLWAMFLWQGGLFMFLSTLFFGIPIIIVNIPLVGLKMFSSKKKGVILFGYITSFLPLIYIVAVLSNLPLRQMRDESGYSILLPEWVPVFIILSCILFIIVSTISFIRVNADLQIQ